MAQSRMPVLFIGHGSPMNAIEDNPWSRAFQEIATLLPSPKAILSLSAHWFVKGTFLTENEKPRTIHDFGGFPKELFAMQYPAPGDIALAKRVQTLLGPNRAALSLEWGLDHGTWSVLHHLRPKADCPVVQLSIDHRLSPQEHLALGEALAPLREEGVLLMGSGNLTHNLRHAITSYQRGETSAPDWAIDFDTQVANALEQHDQSFLSEVLQSPIGQIAHPSPDHYLPLLYTVGASDTSDTIRFPIKGFDLSSISMRSVLFS